MLIPDHPVLKALAANATLSREALDALSAIITLRQYPRHTHLLEIGQIDRQLHFIAKGAGRVYYLRDGMDVTDYFALDNQFLGAIESLFTRQPSHKGIELLEDSEVYSIPYDEFEKLCAQFHEIEHIGRMMAIFGFLQGQKRVESIRFLSAAERYAELEKELPGISNRVPLKHIASFLGTTQVSLSRIRGGNQ